MRRFRAAVTDAAGFAKTSGFVDDTRALCSIPSRHDASRRVDAGYLAQLVAEHRIGLEDARMTMVRLVSDIPRSTFRLPV
jgi:glucuronate isomerase